MLAMIASPVSESTAPPQTGAAVVEPVASVELLACGGSRSTRKVMFEGPHMGESPAKKGRTSQARTSPARRGTDEGGSSTFQYPQAAVTATKSDIVPTSQPFGPWTRRGALAQSPAKTTMPPPPPPPATAKSKSVEGGIASAKSKGVGGGIVGPRTREPSLVLPAGRKALSIDVGPVAATLPAPDICESSEAEQITFPEWASKSLPSLSSLSLPSLSQEWGGRGRRGAGGQEWAGGGEETTGFEQWRGEGRRFFLGSRGCGIRPSQTPVARCGQSPLFAATPSIQLVTVCSQLLPFPCAQKHLPSSPHLCQAPLSALLSAAGFGSAGGFATALTQELSLGSSGAVTDVSFAQTEVCHFGVGTHWVTQLRPLSPPPLVPHVVWSVMRCDESSAHIEGPSVKISPLLLNCNCASAA